MGCDTKGVVVTRFKDVMAMCTLAQKALDKRIVEEIDAVFPDQRRWSKKVQEQFRSADVHLRPEQGMAIFGFRYHGENRSMNMFFTCDCDHLDLGPKSISMSMNTWGSSEVLMKTVLHALSLVGTAHYDYNDCDDIDMAPLREYRPNLLQAVKLGYLSPFWLDTWADKFKELDVASAADKKRFLGCSEATFRKVHAIEKYEDQKAALDKLVAAVSAPLPQFLIDYEQEMALRQDAGLLANASASS